MGMLRVCSTEGCQVKTLGEYCLQHESTAVCAVTRPKVLAAPSRRYARTSTARRTVATGSL